MSPEPKSKIYIYTDGACSGNPGPGGWAFVALNGTTAQVVERGERSEQTTNNRMELSAAIEALRWATAQDASAEIVFLCDSKLLINGAESWLKNWIKKNWKKSDGQDVLNQDLWQALADALAAHRGKIIWAYVPGHANIEGNERADEICVGFAKKLPVELYTGELRNYAGSGAFAAETLHEILGGGRVSAATEKFKACYLSLVDGQLERHSEWSACEQRVKGQKGAKFKKVRSAMEESQTLKGWNFKA